LEQPNGGKSERDKKRKYGGPSGTEARGHRGGGLERDALHRGDEAVALTRNGLDEAGRFGIVIERAAQSGDGDIEAAVEIDKGVLTPKLDAELFAGTDLAGVLREEPQQAVLLGGETYEEPGTAEFPGTEIQLEGAEAKDKDGCGGGSHGFSIGGLGRRKGRADGKGARRRGN
jgi:hypothetical protein